MQMSIESQADHAYTKTNDFDKAVQTLVCAGWDIRAASKAVADTARFKGYPHLSPSACTPKNAVRKARARACGYYDVLDLLTTAGWAEEAAAEAMRHHFSY